MSKSAILPQVRVTPEVRAELESVLRDGESLSEFVEASARQAAVGRRAQAEFLARGLRSLDHYKRSSEGVDADVLLDRLQGRLDTALTARRARGAT